MIIFRRGRTIGKVMGGGSVGRKKYSCKGGWLKTKLCKDEVKKKRFLQSELHCRAYKLYPPEWHFSSHFSTAVLISWSWFLHD